MKKWSEMYPNGRFVYYEGDDPHHFVREMKNKYGFDPSKNNRRHWCEGGSWCFLLPGNCIDDVYDRSKYPLGS